MPENEKALIAYVPVLHAGYMDMFQRHSDANAYLLDQDVLDDFSHLRKDIRALRPTEIHDIIESIDIFPNVSLLGKAALLGIKEDKIIMPNDDVSRQLSADYLTDKDIEFEPVFLRWDRNNSTINVDVEPDRTIPADSIDEPFVELIYEEADKSSDWWRRVGAAIVGDDGVLYVSHNQHLPTEYTPWVDNDPRNNARRGEGVEAATVFHAESALVARAAREGNSLEGTELFVTTFPCPTCAKLIAGSGIKVCYYTEGYAMTDGLKTLRDAEIEVVKIETDDSRTRSGSEWRSYPES